MHAKLILGAFILIVSVLYGFEVRRNNALQVQLASLEADLDRRCAQRLMSSHNKSLSDDHGLPATTTRPRASLSDNALQPDPDTPVKPRHTVEKAVSLDSLHDGSEHAEFLALQQTTRIGESVNITESESSWLKESLSTLYGSSDWDSLPEEEKDARLLATITNTLDAERAAAYMVAKREREQRAENDRLELASSIVSKRLFLSVAQGAQVFQAFKEVQDEIGDHTKALNQRLKEIEASEQSSPQSTAQGLKLIHDAVRDIRDKRRSLLNEKLKPVLSKEQFDVLISEQSAAPSNSLWGIPGY